MKKSIPIIILILLIILLAPTFKIPYEVNKTTEKIRIADNIAKNSNLAELTQNSVVEKLTKESVNGDCPICEVRGVDLLLWSTMHPIGMLNANDDWVELWDKSGINSYIRRAQSIKTDDIMETIPSSSGDWNITDLTIVENQELIVNGSIFIMRGGALVLKNSIIYMKLDSDGEHWIEAFNGGNLTLINSTITSYDPENNYYIKINHGAKLRVEQSEIKYAGYTWGYSGEKTGIWINTDNATIENSKIYDSFVGIYLWNSHNVTIKNNIFVSSGLFVVESYNNVVVNNKVNGKPLVYLEGISGFEVTSAGQVVLVNSSDITITNLELTNIIVGIEIVSSNNVYVFGNNISSNKIGIYLEDSHNCTIYGNNVNQNESGVVIGKSFNNTIRENNITYNLFSMTVYYSYQNNINGNNISDNVIGIDLMVSHNNTVYRNNLSNNGNAIYVQYSQDNVIRENNISEDNYNGISLEGSISDAIYENKVDNNKVGVSLTNSHGNTIYGNTVSNSKVGVQLDHSHNNTLHDNMIINCEYGVQLSYSNNNTIHDNVMNNNKYSIHLGNSNGNTIYMNNVNKFRSLSTDRSS